MPSTSERTGGCLCGAIRYRLLAEPLLTRICWCRDCQHLAGNGTVNALLPSAAIRITAGQPAAYLRIANSGNTVLRRFCPVCGSHLFADNNGRPGFTVVRVGTLDAPDLAAPTANIWAESAPAWACLDPALEQIAQQPAAPPNPH